MNMMLWRPKKYEQILPNSELFASLAVAINIGLEMAESPPARQVFAQLGRTVIESRAQSSQGMPMGRAVRDATDPNPSNMDWHVSNFLQALRRSFPGIVVGAAQLSSPDQLAATTRTRTPWWTGSWMAFNPKAAGIFSFNESVSWDPIRDPKEHQS